MLLPKGKLYKNQLKLQHKDEQPCIPYTCSSIIFLDLPKWFIGSIGGDWQKELYDSGDCQPAMPSHTGDLQYNEICIHSNIFLIQNNQASA